LAGDHGRRPGGGGDRLSDEQPTADDAGERRFTRRETLRRLGSGGATLLGAGLVTGSVATHAAARATGPEEVYDASHTDRLVSSELVVGSDAGPYGGEYSPPAWMEPRHLDRVTSPPAPRRGGSGVDLEMTVTATHLEVALGTTVAGWVYNGTAPGPTIRAGEGELLRIHLRNATDHDHNLHFHGRHSPGYDGWEPVPPGGETTYEIEAGPAGLHPYHCHTMPIDVHISKGLYGAFIVDPPGGRAPAQEVVLILSGWDLDEDGANEVYTWNGVAGFYEKYPIKLAAGEPVRAYVVNAVEYDPVASFHLHAETFDVYPAGIGQTPMFTTDVVTLGQMERAILEFALPERGRYMFHPHQHRLMSRGAMGWFSAI
jgi:FtsP/CotA-like multicopper oxidase with cupredoxin domain